MTDATRSRPIFHATVHEFIRDMLLNAATTGRNYLDEQIQYGRNKFSLNLV